MTTILKITVAIALLSVCAVAQRGTEVWPFLSKNYDADNSGSITAAEYGRGAKAFTNLDKNRDGVITEADFARGAGRGRGGGAAEDDRDASLRRFVELYATFINRDGTSGIGTADWQGLIRAMEPTEDGVIDRANLTKFMGDAANGRMAGMATRSLSKDLDVDGSGAVDAGDLKAIFDRLDTDKSGSLDRQDGLKMPPAIGDMAPDFTLPLADHKDKQITLSAFRGKKPVALIFGSYT